MAKISFGIIVLNGYPFLEYNLRALYPFAHQIIVVEGAVLAAKSLARTDGHSVDDTLEMLQEFKSKHDPQNKLLIVTAVDAGHADGFWPEKDEMSQAYAERATGDWLWQVDSDEFYLETDLAGMAQLLDSTSDVSGYSFSYIDFFGSFFSYITGVWHLHVHPRFYRLFRWGAGYSYVEHRPPTVVDADGRNLHQLKWQVNPLVDGKPVVLRHYSYVFPKQGLQKVGYYSNVSWSQAFQENKRWYEQQYVKLKNPMHLGELGGLQWLERFNGPHPRAILQLREDLRSGKVAEPQRPVQDIESLLDSPWYWVQTRVARLFLWLYWPVRGVWKSMRSFILKLWTTGEE